MKEYSGTPGGIDLFVDKTYQVRVIADQRYGVGAIGYGDDLGPLTHRDLLLDIYQPIDEAADRSPRPALILAFGGAFHRGSRTNDVVEEGEDRNTPVSEYCREFAKRGYVCFSIDYRLMQERPDPGDTPTLQKQAVLNTDRVNHVRGLLGLPPCTQEDMANEIEAATDDMTKAVSYVRARSQDFNIDPKRIAIGGFSAGAIAALNSALAERVPVAAVVALSGRVSMATLERFVTSSRGVPAILMLVGENDLPAMLENLDAPLDYLKRLGVFSQVARIPGGTHFYPRHATTVCDDGMMRDVESTISAFLVQALELRDLGLQ